MSVFKRSKKPDAPYYMDFTLNGKRIAKSCGTTSKREAMRIEEQEKQRLEEVTYGSSPRAILTFREAVERIYRERWKQQKAGDNTYARIQSVLGPYLNDIPLSTITEAVLEDVFYKLRAEGRTESTINRYKAYMKTLFTHAKEVWKVLSDTPVLRLAKEPPGRMRIYTKEEEAQIIKLFESYVPDMADLIQVLADTGCRVGEVLSLTYPANIDFNNRLIRVWANKADIPKSVPMTQRVYDVLRARQSKGGVSVFLLSYNDVIRHWRWLRRQMGWKDGAEVIHGFRHTCATRLYEGSQDLYLVKEYLGHANINTTVRYAHMSPKKLQKAALLLEDAK